MKKALSIIAFATIFCFTANAQEQGDIRASLGLAFGTESGIGDNGGTAGALGLNIGLEYFATDVISIAPSYSYFFKDEVDSDFINASVQLSSINIDGRYYFLTDEIQVYGLLGAAIVNYTIESEVPGFGFGPFLTPAQTVETSDSEFGLNIGGGIVYSLTDNLGLGAQVKYQTPFDGQLVLNGGLTYQF